MDFILNLGTGGHSVWYLTIAIFFAVFISEDLTAIAAAALVVAGKITTEQALLALFGGIYAGEILCYLLGLMARHNKWAKKILEKEGINQVWRWLDNNLVAAVLAARFFPGLRIAVYGAIGFFRLSFKTLILTSGSMIAIWTGGIFFISLKFGNHYWESLGHWRWLVIIGFCAIILFVSHGFRQHLKSFAKHNPSHRYDVKRKLKTPNPKRKITSHHKKIKT